MFREVVDYVRKTKEAALGIVLTLNNEKVDISTDEAKRKVKSLLDALRIQAKRKGWKYHVYIAFSRSNQKIKAERPHFHMLVIAEPWSVVRDWIIKYWNPPQKSFREQYGIVKHQKVNNVGWFVDNYIKGQSEFFREQEKE